MGSSHARFWVLLALFSLVVELVQGPRPLAEWSALPKVVAGRSVAEQTLSDELAVSLLDSEGAGDREDGPDGELGEDSEDGADARDGDQEVGKKRSEPLQLAVFHSHAFLGALSGLLRCGDAARLSDLTYREAPERPPRLS